MGYSFAIENLIFGKVGCKIIKNVFSIYLLKIANWHKLVNPEKCFLYSVKGKNSQIKAETFNYKE